MRKTLKTLLNRAIKLLKRVPKPTTLDPFFAEVDAIQCEHTKNGKCYDILLKLEEMHGRAILRYVPENEADIYFIEGLKRGHRIEVSPEHIGEISVTLPFVRARFVEHASPHSRNITTPTVVRGLPPSHRRPKVSNG